MEAGQTKPAPAGPIPVSKYEEHMSTKVIAALLCILGGFTFLAGTYGFCRLYAQSTQTIHTTGIVTHLNTTKRYIRGKKRFKRTARIQYDTRLYTTHINTQLHNPLISEGSKISLWYYPDHTEKVVIPSEGGIIYGGTCLLGALLLAPGVAMTISGKYRKTNRRTEEQ